MAPFSCSPASKGPRIRRCWQAILQNFPYMSMHVLYENINTKVQVSLGSVFISMWKSSSLLGTITRKLGVLSDVRQGDSKNSNWDSIDSNPNSNPHSIVFDQIFDSGHIEFESCVANTIPVTRIRIPSSHVDLISTQTSDSGPHGDSIEIKQQF